eukprot:Skav232644  [mRNA]  locus=scaffold2334:17884:21719:- [translate_table: standard]
MKSTSVAFVVFESENAKSAAVDAAPHRSTRCTLRPVVAEPTEIIWVTWLWTLLLYLPYAFYMASFTYANGDEPGVLLASPQIGVLELGAEAMIRNDGYRGFDNGQ